MLHLSVLDKLVTLLPAPPAPKELPALVDAFYNKDVLVRLYTHALVPFFEEEGVRYVELKANARKGDFVSVFARFLADAERFRAFLASLPEPTRRTFARVVWFGACSLGRLEEEMGYEIIRPEAYQEQRSWYGYSRERMLPDVYDFFAQGGDYYARHPQRRFLTLPPWLQAHLQTILPPPPGHTLQPLSAPPETAIYRVEPTALHDLIRYDLFVREGHLALTKSGRPRAASLRNMEAMTGLKPFFAEDRGALGQVAAGLLAEVLLAYAPDREPADGLPLLTTLLQSYFTDPEIGLADLFLTHLKQRAYAYDPFLDRQTRLALLELTKRLPAGEWIDVDALHDHAVVHNLPLRLFSTDGLNRVKVDHVRHAYVDERKAKDYYAYGSDRAIGLDYADHAVTRPLLRGHFALMALLGVVDLAYERPRNDVVQNASYDFLTPFDGVRAVRLTPLGAYLTGRAKSYVAPSAEAPSEAEVHLDDTYLVFTLSAEDKIKEMIADNLAERLGPRRYRLSYAAFLKGCTTRADVDDQVRRFHRHLAADVPSHFEAFFRDVRHKVDPLTPVPRMLIFKLDGGPELVRHLATDPVLQRYIRKAEGPHILVEEPHWSRVKNRLQTLGYLVSR